MVASCLYTFLSQTDIHLRHINYAYDDVIDENEQAQKMLRGSWREIPRDVLVLGEELGSGMFGRVVKAWLRKESGESQMCAVKMLKGEATNVEGGNDVAMPLFGTFLSFFF